MKNGILIKVLLAMLLALFAGWAAGPKSQLFGVTYVNLFGLIGQLFLNALSLVVVPLVVASIITGTARMGGGQTFGSLGLKTLGYFVLTSFFAILVGLLVVKIFSPGYYYHRLSSTLSSSVSSDLTLLHTQMEEGIFFKIEQILVKLIPGNIVAAAANGQMLGLILFSLLFGFFATRIDPQISSILLGFWQGVFQVMMQMTHLVLKALPFGVFGLVAKAVATTGADSLSSVAYFFGTVLLGLFLYGFVLLSLLLRFVAGVNPIAHFKALIPALVTAFSTSSSAATLPVTLECVEKRAGISNRVASFVLPLGTSINLSGSSLYVIVGVIFIAQAYGLALSWPTLMLIVFMTLVFSLGSAGIPSASLISIVVILQTLGLPGEAVGLLMTVERLLDMFRTPINVYGTSVCAALVARSEGEKKALEQPANVLP